MKNFRLLISILSICVFAFLAIGSEDTPSSSSSVSDPGVCNCWNNAMKAGTANFNQSIQTRCENYAATLTQSEKEARVRRAFNCN